MATESAAVEHKYSLEDGPGMLDMFYSLIRKNLVTFLAFELFGHCSRRCWTVIIESIGNNISRIESIGNNICRHDNPRAATQKSEDIYSITGIITEEGPTFTTLRRFKVPRTFTATYDIRRRTGTLQITTPFEE